MALGCKGTSRDLRNLVWRTVRTPASRSTSSARRVRASVIRSPVQASNPIRVA